ncbi:zinc finger protein 653 [Perca flavescens]|uniref:zinc finger protein 653 n=1 Tax=Perca flavescens TaxID=8167 RepID=UPI00106ED5DC|nr:zinc finger protein 653-like [Perca flavescens]
MDANRHSNFLGCWATTKMALSLAELEAPLAADPAGDRDRDRDGGLRRCRGRPRLTDSDRAQRRLESRKKYDVRRVYLGEAHKLWSEVRRRTGLSDAGLAEYLILLNSTYGERYQQEFCGKKGAPQVSGKHKKGRTGCVSSLQSLVRWYQDHASSCPLEPQLRALEPQHNFSTAAVWRCGAHHSFVQYLSPPPRAASDSEHEERGNGDEDEDDDEEESAAKTDASVAKAEVCRRRRKDTQKQYKDVGRHVEVSEEQQTTMSPIQQAATPAQLPREEASSQDVPLTGQPVWEMEMEMERQEGPPAAEFHSSSSSSEEEEEEEEDLRLGRDPEDEIRTVPHGHY